MQHEILVDQFERYLAGEASLEFHDHLAVCSACRNEVAAMESMAGVLRAELATGAEIQPSLGFYNRLAGHIVEEQRLEFWGLFSPGVGFFRRVAFASLLLLASLGTFLATKEASAGGADAASIMAQHDAMSVHAESSDRDRLLVTLASYHE